MRTLNIPMGELVITGREGGWRGRGLVSLFQQEDHSWREKGITVKWRQGAGLEGPYKGLEWGLHRHCTVITDDY